MDEKLKSCPPERFVEPFEGMLAEIVICHQLRTSAGLMDAEYTRRMGRPTTSDRAQRMRDAADLIEALARPSDRNDVIEECARLVERRAEERFNEHGTREWDTNATYYEGAVGETYEALDEEDEAIAAAIRARKD